MKCKLDIDVLVVGAGVAGSTAALSLARLGYKVVVLEQKAEGSPKVGECLPPKALKTIKMLGLEEQFLKDAHLSMQGYRVAWDDSGVYDRNLIAAPNGFGWLLNRKRFDKMLIDVAFEKGCSFSWNSKLDNLIFDNGLWEVAATTKEKSITYNAKAIIDATGRPRSVSRRLGAKTKKLDNLIACISFLVHPEETVLSQDVLIEKAENGWWYNAPYSSKASVLCYFTDGDLPQPKSSDELLLWSQKLPEMGERLAEASPQNSKMLRAAANSSALDHCGGSKWIAVGDAACSFDPLSSYGITSALGSGYYGGMALAEELAGKKDHIAAYQSLMQQTFLAYLPRCKAQYQRVKEFDSPFWSRRQ